MTRDPLDDLGQGDRGLIEFFSHLTSEPTAAELSGEYAALTMFRTARDAAPSASPAPSAVQARRRRGPSRARLGGRLAAAGMVVALGGGFAAAGYAEVLPAPLQHVAHEILGFAGVKNSPGKPSPGKPTVPVTGHRSTGGAVGPGESSSPRPGSSGSKSPSPRSSSPSPRPSSSASPSSSHAGSVTITAAQGQIAAGGSVVITASFTRRGKAVPGVSLSLAEMPGGRTTWHVVGQATTGSSGKASFTVQDLTTNASFRVTGPGGAESAGLRIVVIPAITVSQVPGAHGQSTTLVVSIPLAQRGDAVTLEDLVNGQWQVVRRHVLRQGGQATFSVAARKISVTYRVVLPATVEHGQAISPEVTVAAHPKGGPGRH